MALEAELDKYKDDVDAAVTAFLDANLLKRIWDKDHTVWRPDPDEIANRLDWLTIAADMRDNIDAITAVVDEVREAGFTDVLLCGMGGSSLAPEVFSLTFGKAEGYLDLHVLDSTDPGAVATYADSLDLEKTIFIIASKSGGTAETLSFFKYFYNAVEGHGEQFIAVTDPGSKLVKKGEELGFRKVFENNPNIGGRYSALSYFGLVPAAMLGVDLDKLLDHAVAAMDAYQKVDPVPTPVTLGVALAVLAKEGRDKLTLLASPEIESFGDWVEQLVAESTGKQGQGILPIVGEPIGAPSVYGDDRVFVHLALDGDSTHEVALKALRENGHPTITLPLDDVYELGEQFLLWELATAIAGQQLDIQPFDQPNVESAKRLARAMIDEYAEKGELPEGEIAPLEPDALKRFLDSSSEGDYICLQAFIQPEEDTSAALAALRLAVRDHYKLATTMGYGPRYLHSTGQLHKGDDGSGLFVQFIADHERDLDIPDEAGEDEATMTFGVLKNAQALGDAEALREETRRIIRFNLGADVKKGLATLTEPFT